MTEDEEIAMLRRRIEELEERKSGVEERKSGVEERKSGVEERKSDMIRNANRERVLSDYNSAMKKNEELYLRGNTYATSEYIYPNQKEDAFEICNKFYTEDISVISVVKRTKVGMDGLMIEIAKNMCTHPDNDFAKHSDDVFIITGMSNISWEINMKDKIPDCFKKNVFHHGKLQRLKKKLENIENSLIIIDEIDTGDKEDQKLHKILKNSGILNIDYIIEKNIYFVFVSATSIDQLNELYKWGDKHQIFRMTIPDSYIGHKEFLDREIIKQYYPVTDLRSAEKWILEDIIDNYGTDYRVHLIRTTKKYEQHIHDACIKHGIEYKNHTSKNKINRVKLDEIFDNELQNHLVISVKEFYRRANLIPNQWKLKIGATHERCVKTPNIGVVVQGFPGRMSGYWKQFILDGHKTGPYRTSIESINIYEDWYKHLTIINNSSIKKTFLHPRNIQNLETDDSNTLSRNDLRKPTIIKRKTFEEIMEYYNNNMKNNEKFKNTRGPSKIRFNKRLNINDGYYYNNVRNYKIIQSCSDILNDIRFGLKNNSFRIHCCYENINDKSTLQLWLIYYDD